MADLWEGELTCRLVAEGWLTSFSPYSGSFSSTICSTRGSSSFPIRKYLLYVVYIFPVNVAQE